MQFRLTYQGPLAANGRAIEKHKIRRHFHPQLRELWSRSPLKDFRDIYLADPPREAGPSLLSRVEPFRFAPLVSSKIDLIASLDILFLRRDEPGGLVTIGGDIDNRIKTLLDALRMPKAPSELAKQLPGEGEDPFFCLLEDDALVTELAVVTDRLLEPPEESSKESHVHLIIKVTIRAARVTWGNTIFLG